MTAAAFFAWACAVIGAGVVLLLGLALVAVVYGRLCWRFLKWLGRQGARK